MTEFRKVTHTFNVRRKLTLWDKFLNIITGTKRSVVQEVEVNFLYDSSVDPEDVDLILSGVYLVESKCIRKEEVPF